MSRPITGTRPRPPAHVVLRALGALLLLAAVLAGLPALLAFTAGNPLDQWGDLVAGDVSDRVVVAVLAGVAYLAWAQFAAAVLAELAAGLFRRRRAVRLVGVFPAQQRLAHALVAALVAVGPLVLSAQPAQATGTTPPGAGPDRPVASAPAAVAQPDPTSHRAGGPGELTVVTADGPGTYWDLATEHLGSGQRWGEIWALNRGRVQPDGVVMTDPGLLRPGWTVVLPSVAPTPALPDGGTAGEVVVEPGDTLTGIAAAHDIADWHRLWQANVGRPQPAGNWLHDPDHIEPGWRIRLPSAGIRPANPAANPAQHAAAHPAANPVAAVPPAPTVPAESVAPVAGGAGDPVASVRATEVAPPSTVATPAGAPTSSAAATATEAPTAPSAHPAPVVGEGDLTPPADGDETSRAALVAAGLGAGLLGGTALLAWRSARRRQRRHRRPGRAIPPVPISARPIERALRTATTADVEWLDEALRGLARSLAGDPAGRLPDVVAAALDRDGVELVLAQPVRQAPGEWQPRDGGRRWYLPRHAGTGYDPQAAGEHAAPYPALASIGIDAGGRTWLLDLEHVALLGLTGDPQRCRDLARYLAAELAQSPWPDLVYVTTTGLDADLAAVNRERLVATGTAAEVTRSVHAALSHARSMSDAITQIGLDVLPGRLLNVSGDIWFPQVLILADDPPPQADTADLLAALTPGQRLGQAVVVTGALAEQVPAPWRLSVTREGRVRLPALDLDLTAHRLTRRAATDLAHLFAVADTPDDAAPEPARAVTLWAGAADVHGGLQAHLIPADSDADVPAAGGGGLPAVRLARDPVVGEPAAVSVLPLPAAAYTDAAFTTAEDLAAVAPAVPAPLARTIGAGDAGLDDDLAAWHDPACPRPKVRLLGPVEVRAHGTLPPGRPRTAWNTEIVAYLATRPGGVSGERLAEDLWPAVPGVAGSSRVRQALSIARTWLGHDPVTGAAYLPPAGLGADGRGGTYRIAGALVDADLCARLRLRGSARGPYGITDLRAALDLVTGMPFDRQRPGGYAWLADTPLDQEYTAMIVDIAHLLVVHHLAAGDPAAAHAAASVAAQAAPYDDVPLLDLIAACDALGLAAEAEVYLARLYTGHDATGPDDLPDRTARLLAARHTPHVERPTPTPR